MKKYLAILITVCFGLFFQQNVFADSNPTVTFTGGTSVSSTVSWFPNCDASCYENYSYLKITSSSAPISVFYSNMRIYFIPADENLSATQVYLNISTETYYKIDDVPIKDIKFAQNITPAYTFTAELVSELGPQPEPCPEPEPCPDCETPPFVQIVVDAFWKYHVAFAAAVPAILVIFLVYRLIKGRLR